MATARVFPFLAAVLFLSALSSCRQVEVGELYALRLDAPPGDSAWEAAVPLVMKGGGGHINGRDERIADLERDTDTVHADSASCHHGPPITDPVFLEARSYYTAGEIHLELRWEDPTTDTTPRLWEKRGGEWRLGESDEDGVAVLWSRVAGPFGCQEACHMKDFSLRGGEFVDLRAMRMAEEGQWEEAWIWKAAQGSQALILGSGGFATADAGETYRVLNSAVAADISQGEATRRAGTFGPDDRPLLGGEGRPLQETEEKTTAYLYAGRDGDGGLTARTERRSGRWRVTFTRKLEAGEGRQPFRPGERYRFGVALFDGTSTNHHIVRDTQVLDLVLPQPRAEEGVGAGEEEDAGEGRGIL